MTKPTTDHGGPAVAPDADEAFRAKAREILADGRKVSAGVLHFIALDEIREQLGNRWEAVRDRVHDYTAKLLNKSLSAQDIWFRHGDYGYVVVFARLEMTEAKLVCAHIADSLQTALLGHRDTRQVSVRTAVLEVDGSIAIHSTQLAELLDQAASHASVPHDAAAPPAPPAPDEAQRGELPDDFSPQILFRPIFDVRNKVISTHVCRLDADTQRYVGCSFTDETERTAASFAVDLKALTDAVAVYEELYANRFRYNQVLPVHFDTMAAARRRGEYLRRCRAIPRHLLPFLAFELAGVPRGIPSSRLGEIVAALKPFGRGVFVQGGDETAADLVLYAGVGVLGVGMTLDRHHDGNRGGEKLQGFCPMVRRAGMFSYVDGVRNAAMLYAAEAAGASYLCGPAIGADSEVPEHMQRSSEEELLQRSSRRTGPGSANAIWG